MAFSYGRIGEHLDRLARRYGKRHECHSIANEIIGRLDDLGIGEIFQLGLHEFTQDCLAQNVSLSNEIGRAYYF